MLKGRPAVLAKDPDAAGTASLSGSTWAITDGNQRRAVTFGQISNTYSYLLGPGQRPGGSPAGVPLNYQVVPGSDTQTVAAPLGASSVSATSYGSTPLYNEPSEGPDSAFDADPTTAWVATAANNSVGQSLSITFNRAVPFTTIHITPLDNSPLRPRITGLTLTTDAGAVKRALPLRNGPVEVKVAHGSTRHLTITISSVSAPSKESFLGPLGAGITDVAIPGISFRPAMQLPTDDVSSFAGSD